MFFDNILQKNKKALHALFSSKKLNEIIKNQVKNNLTFCFCKNEHVLLFLQQN